MGPRILVSLLLLFLHIIVIEAETHVESYVALNALKDIWNNTPPSWVGSDPCGDNWEAIRCTNSHVTSIMLSSMSITGQLSGDIQGLSELITLDLSYNKGLSGVLPPSIGSLNKLSSLILVGCSFSGLIPDTIGSLKQLVILSLNSNRFNGRIPPSIGNLSNLYQLDLADNQLTGTIPVSNETSPGLDLLVHTKHFHFGKNKLSGTIPAQLFNSNMTLIHVIFDSNQLTGAIPSTLGLVRTLEVVNLDRNSLSGPVPPNINNLTIVNELILSNNKLTGHLPDLIGMNLLYHVDMSNNSFDMSYVPTWFSTLQSLTTLRMENTQLHGPISDSLFALLNLQTVVLRNNQLEGILDIGTSYSNQLRLIDLQKNLITGFTHSAEFNITIILLGNPICEGGGVPDGYCRVLQSNSSYSTPQNNCVPAVCLSDQSSSPNCKCACPYAGTLVFVAPSFSDLDNSSYYITLEESLMHSFRTHDLPVDSVSLSNPTKNSFDYLELSLEVFPSGQNRFNRTGISMLGFTLSSRTFNPPRSFGLFYFLADEYTTFAEVAISTTPSIVIIIGAVAGGSVLVLFLFLAGVYAFCQKRKARATNNTPFAFWNPNTSSGGIPQLQGARCFSFEELKECTNNFSEANSLGSGGYGKVYRGDLPSGQLVAIKRAQQGSMQSGVQFKTEIELLSRVHHKNIVSLVGFCFEQGEEMLIYEYVPNGTLMESLSGKSGIRLDWMRRLKVALGTGRGLAYLHEHANPPIIHRDIKSTNILLDEGLNAKVADFGLSKLMADDGKGHVVTQVKGTMGYLDPEYYETQELTSKSDVYSFGVVMLELISAKRPIERGRFIVREMREATEVYEILDPAIGFGTTPKGIERFVNLAMACVQESGAVRPTMGEVVKEIESIMQMAGLNPNDVESESYNEEATFDYSGVFPLSKIEPQ